MALFDFNRLAFYRLPLNLGAKEWEGGLANLRSQAANDTVRLSAILSEISSEAAFLNSRRAELLDRRRESPTERNASHRFLASSTRRAETLQLRRADLEFQRDFPELTGTMETKELFSQIEKEVLQTVAEVASELGLEVVLNRSIPLPSESPAEFRNMPRNPISFFESDLYYGFLAGRPATAQDATSVPNNPAELWLNETRNPQIHELMKLNPHPLVLKGGLDLTPEVISRLFEKYQCSSESLRIILKTLSKKENP